GPTRYYTDFAAGPAKINGVYYARLFYGGDMQVISQPIVLPNPSGRPAARLYFSAPFSFRWNFHGCTSSSLDCPGRDEVFHDTITGQGVMTIRLNSYYLFDGRFIYNTSSFRFDFLPPEAMPAATLACALARLWPATWQTRCAPVGQAGALKRF